LEVWAFRFGLLSWFFNLDGQRNGKIDTDDCRFSGFKIGKKGGSGTIDLTTGALDNLPVSVIRQTMHNESAHLTKNTFWNVSRALRRKADVQAVFAALFRNQLKGIQTRRVFIKADAFVEELMSLIDEQEKRQRFEDPFPSSEQKVATDRVGDNLARVEIKTQMLKRYTEEPRLVRRFAEFINPREDTRF